MINKLSIPMRTLHGTIFVMLLSSLTSYALQREEQNNEIAISQEIQANAPVFNDGETDATIIVRVIALLEQDIADGKNMNNFDEVMKNAQRHSNAAELIKLIQSFYENHERRNHYADKLQKIVFFIWNNYAENSEQQTKFIANTAIMAEHIHNLHQEMLAIIDEIKTSQL